MRISWNWLSRHLDTAGLDPFAVGEQFTLKVAELDGVIRVGQGLDGIRTARVVSAESLAGSDHLSRVVITDGTAEHVLVCGATNALRSVGKVVAWAPPGSTLPDGKRIGQAEIRGVMSSGMLASEKELGLSLDHAGILVLHDATPVGQALTAAIPELADVVFEVDNKAITHRPDLWGHYGIAREVAILTGRTLKPLEPKPVFGSEPRVKVTVREPVLCPRYLAATFEGVTVEPSPEWLRTLVRTVGMRPINTVVDLTNFVMLDTANPVHAFDARFVRGGSLVVRRAADRERLVTLDGNERTCTDETLLICDGAGPVAIAGVMGGYDSEIKSDTTEVVLEAANFQARSVRRASARLGLRTEASARFEKALDPGFAHLAARHFTSLLLQVCPSARVSGALVDVKAPEAERTIIRLNPNAVSRRLGMEVQLGTTRTVLKQLGCDVQDSSSGELRVVVPTWRATKDVAIAEDLIEEIGRLHGYGNIPPKPSKVDIKAPALSLAKVQERTTRSWLALACGRHEVLSYAFVHRPTLEKLGCTTAGHLKMENTISAEWDHLRRSLVPNLLLFAERNARQCERFGLFELGRLFVPPDEPGEGRLPSQDRWVGLMTVHAATEDDAELRFRALKGEVAGLIDRLGLPAPAFVRPGDLDGGDGWLGHRRAWVHPQRSAAVVVGNAVVGYLTLLHPKAALALDVGRPMSVAELNLEALLQVGRVPRKYEPLPRFPAIQFDLSFEVAETVTAGAIAATVRAGIPSGLLREVEHFASFRLPGGGDGKGKKSVSFHLTFRAEDRSLTDAEVKALVDQAVERCTERHDAVLRGA